jgi:hypothetical protein
MSFSIPTRADDRITNRVASREFNAIRHIVPLSQLLMLTSSAEWRMATVNSDAITPDSISVDTSSAWGASNVQPVIINAAAIYCEARGGHLRELTYKWENNGFTTGDTSIYTPHLFDFHEIVDLTLQKARVPVIWAVSSSGLLLGLTYLPEQQVGAWHAHETDGVFESCCVVAEGNEDVLYVVVRREVMGQQVRYIERQRQRRFAELPDAFHVDSGLSYDRQTPADELSGLEHLEGKTVAILADGATHPTRVVVNGAITLDHEASKVHVGLPFFSTMKTLPVVMENIAGYGAGRPKNVNKAWLRCYRSSGVWIGPNEQKLVEYKQRTTEPYGEAPVAVSGEVEIMASPSWGESGQMLVVQRDPLPLTLLSIAIEIAVGG